MFKNVLRLMMIVLITTGVSHSFAFDQMAKEETMPPPAEGALTPEQIPPMYSKTENLPPKA